MSQYEAIKAELPDREVPLHMNRLASEVSDLESDVKELEARLTRLLRPTEEKYDDRQNVPRDALYTEAGRHLDETLLTVRMTQSRVRSILERLEV